MQERLKRVHAYYAGVEPLYPRPSPFQAEQTAFYARSHPEDRTWICDPCLDPFDASHTIVVGGCGHCFMAECFAEPGKMALKQLPPPDVPLTCMRCKDDVYWVVVPSIPEDDGPSNASLARARETVAAACRRERVRLEQRARESLVLVTPSLPALGSDGGSNQPRSLADSDSSTSRLTGYRLQDGQRSALSAPTTREQLREHRAQHFARVILSHSENGHCQWPASDTDIELLRDHTGRAHHLGRALCLPQRTGTVSGLRLTRT